MGCPPPMFPGKSAVFGVSTLHTFLFKGMPVNNPILRPGCPKVPENTCFQGPKNPWFSLKYYRYIRLHDGGGHTLGNLWETRNVFNCTGVGLYAFRKNNLSSCRPRIDLGIEAWRPEDFCEAGIILRVTPAKVAHPPHVLPRKNCVFGNIERHNLF